VARLFRSHRRVTRTNDRRRGMDLVFGGKKQAEDFSPVILSESWSKN